MSHSLPHTLLRASDSADTPWCHVLSSCFYKFVVTGYLVGYIENGLSILIAGMGTFLNSYDPALIQSYYFINVHVKTHNILGIKFNNCFFQISSRPMPI